MPAGTERAGRKVGESPEGGPLLAPAGRQGGLRRSSDSSPPDLRILDGSNAGKVSRAYGQAAEGQVSRRALRSSIQSPAALGGSDSDERVLDSSVGRRASAAGGGGHRSKGDGGGARGAPLP